MSDNKLAPMPLTAAAKEAYLADGTEPAPESSEYTGLSRREIADITVAHLVRALNGLHWAGLPRHRTELKALIGAVEQVLCFAGVIEGNEVSFIGDVYK